MATKTARQSDPPRIQRTPPVRATPMRIGAGFEALGFRQEAFDGLMDPIVMVDHYTMSEPTFGVHPHAGMSAVSVLFEDSVGRFRNRDSLGNDIDLLPGDLYWLEAGRGVLHDESPRPGSVIHGLQIFVNLPSRLRHDAPESLHVGAAQMPVIEGAGHRVRVVLGETRGVVGAASPALPLTILDGNLDLGGSYSHPLGGGQAAWVHVVGGEAELAVDGVSQPLRSNESVALRTNAADSSVEIRSEGGAQFVLLQGAPLREPFVQRGPFVMSTSAELDAVAAAHAAGELGSLR